MKERLKIDLGIILIIILCTLFLIQVSDTQLKVKGWYNLDKAGDLLKTLSWLKEHSQANDVVLTPWTLGYQVVTYTDRKVIATSKVYPSQIKAVAERYKDISTFFFSQNEEDALKIIRKYNVKYIFFPKKFEFWICRYIQVCDLIVDNEGYSDIRQLNTIVGQMLNYQTFKNFALYYKSKHYIIYKFLGDV